MKVLEVIPSLAAKQGGPTEAVVQLCTELSRQGNCVSALTTITDDRSSADAHETIAALDRQRVTVHKHRRTGPRRLSYSRSLREWCQRRLATYDVVHVHSLFNYVSLVSCRECSRLGVPFVLSPHGMLAAEALGRRSLAKRVYLNAVGRTALREANAVIALSSKEAAEVRRVEGRARVRVIPNGVIAGLRDSLPERGMFRRRHNLKGIVILYLGRIHPIKGLETLLRAFGLLTERWVARRPVQLVLVGPGTGAYRRKISRTIGKYGLEESAVVLDAVYGDMKLSALRDADVLVMPSRSEGMSMSVLEGLAAGCAVITSEAAAVEGMDRARAGIVVHPGSVESWAEMLLDVSRSAKKRRALTAQGLEFVNSQYTWPIICKRLRGIYSLAVGNGRR